MRDDAPLLVFEPVGGGHRPEFVAWIADAWHRSGTRRPLQIAGPAELREVAALLSHAVRDDLVEWIPTSAAHMGDTAPGHVRALLELVAMSGASHALVAYLETFLRADTLWPRWPASIGLSGILMRPTFHYGSIGSPARTQRERLRRIAKARLTTLAMRQHRVRTVFSLDPTAVAPLRERSQSTQVLHLPDPVPSLPDRQLEAAQSRALSGVPADRHFALLAGQLDQRKNVHRLLQALRHVSKETAQNLTLVLAGPVADTDREALCSAVERIRADVRVDVQLRMGYVSDTDLAGLVEAADSMLLTYDNHVGSSGFMMRAARAGTPVLAQSFGLLGHLTREHQLGQTVDASSPIAIAAALDRAVQSPKAGFDRAAAAQFAQRHSVDAFGRTLIAPFIS